MEAVYDCRRRPRLFPGLLGRRSTDLSCLALVVGERYLGFDRRRWWQFNLRMLLAITFVVGTILGIVLRCVAAAGRDELRMNREHGSD